MTEEQQRRERLVGTGEAARALGISSTTLQRYVREGWVTPDVTLPGRVRHQYRWNVRKLREQIRALAERSNEQES